MPMLNARRGFMNCRWLASTTLFALAACGGPGKAMVQGARLVRREVGG